MTKPRAYQEVTLAHGGNTVRLRPMLRAACELERLHDGFSPLLAKLQEGDTATLRKVIASAATDQRAADRMLHDLKNIPVVEFIETLQKPALDLVAAIFPETEPNPENETTEARTTWPEIFDGLYRIATGWLEWPPELAWTATPYEITAAYKAHIEKLQALHGTTDQQDATDDAPDPDQRERNIEEGLDPDFDREGLRALKARLQQGVA